MISYKLSQDGKYAAKLIDSEYTGEWCNTETNQAYLKWLEEGNTPEPADEVTE